MDKEAILRRILQQWNIKLSDEQTGQLITFYELLFEKNKVMNLTAITDFEEVCSKHFLDSLSAVKLFGEGEDWKRLSGAKKTPALIDVGCGAGFPGIPLAIFYPELQVTLLDSLQKRVFFLQEVIEKAALTNCCAFHARAEEFAREKEHRQAYDIAVSRAVANLSTLSEYCLPFVKKGGIFIAYKSSGIRQEAPAAKRALTLLGGSFERQVEFDLPIPTEEGEEEKAYRNLYVVRKSADTPDKYPRKAPLAKKEPL